MKGRRCVPFVRRALDLLLYSIASARSLKKRKGGFSREVPQAINDKKNKKQKTKNKKLNQIQENIGQPLLR